MIAIKANVHQNKDGAPHLAYYRRDFELSFVWDMESEFIQVSWGGYGEPVFALIKRPGEQFYTLPAFKDAFSYLCEKVDGERLAILGEKAAEERRSNPQSMPLYIINP